MQHDRKLAILCTSIVASVADEQLGPMSEVGERGAATATSDEYVTCVEPAQRKRLEGQKTQAPAP